MISNQILQTTIDGLKGITRIDLCICDTEGKVLASTFPEAEEYENSILSFVESPADSQVIQGYQFFKVFDEHQLEYILLAKGSSDDVYMVGKLAAFQIQNLLVAYKERFDKDNFIKNLLLDNLLLVDIYNRAKKLHIEQARRLVYVIEVDGRKDSVIVEMVKNLFAECNKAFGDKVDVLVNVVGGIVGRKKITEQDEDWYDFLMDVNMRSVFLCTREVVPMMPEGGSIVNFSSLAARDGGGNGASMYATAKGAVMTFTRSMAKELGPQGIRCNAICPGTIATSFHDRFNTPENRERMKGSYALRREGTADEVAELVCFLACSESSYLTGTNIDINGGCFFS